MSIENKFTFSWTDSNGKNKQCFCIGANNCSDINCPLVKERMDKAEKWYQTSLWEQK